jgi:ureidoglycolate hydrolase
MKVKIKKLTHESIRPYGYIIDSKCVTKRPDGNGFGILMKERSGGWRIAYLVLRGKIIKRMECHPNSPETFEPVKGSAIIALASSKSPERVNIFLLDKPVVLKKGVWHGLATLTKETHIKIFENIDVKIAYHPLRKEYFSK